MLGQQQQQRLLINERRLLAMATMTTTMIRERSKILICVVITMTITMTTITTTIVMHCPTSMQANNNRSQPNTMTREGKRRANDRQRRFGTADVVDIRSSRDSFASTHQFDLPQFDAKSNKKCVWFFLSYSQYVCLFLSLLTSVNDQAIKTNSS